MAWKMISDSYTYDLSGNPQKIYFTNGSITKYVYSATGQKLRMVHYTAKANISRAIGQQVELKASEIQSTDSTDYLLGGSLVVRNGKIDRYLFDGGYAKATASGTTDNFAFFYQNRDHLGTVRETVTSTGAMKQRVNYYPFGGQLVDTLKAMVLSPNFQQYKYNGKEFDNMYGLNTYDYGARQHYPVLARWDRIDPLCEKYYNITPYNYCSDNPVNTTDPDGRGPIIGAIIGGAVELGTQLIENYDTEKSIMDNLSGNVNWTNVGIAAGEGALTSGASALKGLGAKITVSAVSSAAKEVSNQVKNGAKSYKDINFQEVGKKTITGAAITGGAGKIAKVKTDAKFKGVKAKPTNAIKHQRGGQKRYSKSAQHKANQKLQKQKEEYTENQENYWKNGANFVNSFIERFSK